MIRKFIYILFFIFSISNVCVAQEALQKVRINDFSGGMDSKNLADVIATNKGVSASNVTINRKGRISKRKGQDLFCEDVGSTAFTGVGRFDPDQSTSYLVAASGTSIIRATTSDQAYVHVNAHSPLSGSVTISDFVQANNLLFVLNGVDDTSWWDGANWYIGEGFSASSPPSATTGVWLKNFLLLAGNPSEPDWVYVSYNLDPTIFSDDIVRINTGDGQVIQRLEAFREDEVIVYKERSIYVVNVQGATVDDWSTQPISKAVGCIAPRSVVSLGNDQWFLSSNPIAVRSLVRSQFDKILVDIVSDPIQDIFDGSGETTINTAQIEKSAAVLFDNKYILAIPVGNSNVNNLVLVYDFIAGGWYKITGWYPSDWIVFDERLFYADANDGRVIEVFTGTTGDFSIGPSSITAASTPDVGIAFEYSSRAIDFDKPEDFKQLDAIELEMAATGGYTAALAINLDNDGWTDVGTINLAGGGVTLPATLPFTLSSSGVARNTFQLQQYGEFKKIQIRVTNNGLDEQSELNRATIFARPRPWRRE